jgi:putative lipoic acid-binding regulatory protein
MSKDYSRLKELLETQESFPLEFTYKFIGKNTPAFATGVGQFEKAYPKLKLQSSRMSKGDAHVALTYVITAGDADQIIQVFEAISRIPDLHVIL